MSKFEPKKRYFREDNWNQTQNIVSMFPQDVQAGQWDRPRDRSYDRYDRYRRYRKPRTNFSDEEKAGIMHRVRLFGAERAAEEAGTTKEIVMSWINEIDENISQLNTEWEEGAYEDSDEANESAKTVIGDIQVPDIKQESTSVSASIPALSAASSSSLSASPLEETVVKNATQDSLPNTVQNIEQNIAMNTVNKAAYDRNSLKSEAHKNDEKGGSSEQNEQTQQLEIQLNQEPQEEHRAHQKSQNNRKSQESQVSQKGQKTCYNNKNNSPKEAKSVKTKSVESKTEPKTKPQASTVVSPLYKDARLKKVKINQLVPFDKHPFRVPDNDSPEMQKLISSIEKEGLLNPPIVRRINNTPNIPGSQENVETAETVADGATVAPEHDSEQSPASNAGGEIYQIVCGHRRIEACKVLGYKDVLVRVVDFADDDEATLAMISSNVQREKIEFPEKVRACSLMYEAKKHQGVVRSEEGSLTRAYVGKIWNVGSTTIERFLKLAKLSDGLLDLIGRKKITSIVGMEIADMSPNMQNLMESIFFENKDLKPRLQQAQEIKARGEMTREEVIALLQQEEKPAPKKFAIRFSSDEMRKILPDEENPTEERVKTFIFERLGISL